VTAYAERLGGLHTAKNVALAVEGKDVRFYAELAANTMLSPAHVVSALGETEPEIFYLGTAGGLRLIDGELPLVLGEARRMGCTTVVDVLMPEGGEWGHLTPALPLVDVLHCNSLEGASLTGAESPGEALDRIVEAGVKLAVITRGAAGLMAAKRGMKF